MQYCDLTTLLPQVYMAIIICPQLRLSCTLTSLLDAQLHSGAYRPHRADCLALVLALVMGCHLRDAQSTGRQDHMTAI